MGRRAGYIFVFTPGTISTPVCDSGFAVTLSRLHRKIDKEAFILKLAQLSAQI